MDQKLGGLEQFVHGLLREWGVRNKREGLSVKRNMRASNKAGVKQNMREMKKK